MVVLLHTANPIAVRVITHRSVCMYGTVADKHMVDIRHGMYPSVVSTVSVLAHQIN